MSTCTADSDCGGFNYQKTPTNKCWYRVSPKCSTEARNDRDCYERETRPTGRASHSSVVYDNKMIVFGGHDGSNFRNDVWEFQLDTSEWSAVTTSGTNIPPRNNHEAVVFGDKMIVFGGATGAGRAADSNALFTLDLKTYVWSQIPNSGTWPEKVCQHSSIVYGDKMIVFGGIGPSGMFDGDDVWSLDMNSYQWQKLTTSGQEKPSERYAHSSIFYNNKMFVFSGETSGGKADNTVWVLNLQTNAWQKLVTTGNGPTPRSQHVSISYSHYMVVIFGEDTSGTRKNDIYSLNLNTNVWSQVTISGSNGTPSARGYFSVVTYSDTMLLYGGSGHEKDIWKADKLMSTLIPLPNINMCDVKVSESGQIIYGC